MSDLADVLAPALARVRSLTGVSLAFSGSVTSEQRLSLDHFDGSTVGALSGVELEAGDGLGGRVVVSGRMHAVDDYSTEGRITHRYDKVIAAEGLRAMVAYPIVVRRAPVAVLYAAVTYAHSFGDRVIDVLSDEARELGQQLAVDAALTSAPADVASTDSIRDEQLRAAYAQLRIALADTQPGKAHERLSRACDAIEMAAQRRSDTSHKSPVTTAELTSREIDVLSLVACGLSNAAVGESLSLSIHTVKSYMKALTNKLDASGRLEAVVHARRLGLLP